jgi:hypothetical protein
MTSTAKTMMETPPKKAKKKRMVKKWPTFRFSTSSEPGPNVI